MQRDPEPHWMTKLYYSVHGVEGRGGVWGEIKSIKARQARMDLRLMRILLWGGVFLVTWTLVTARDVNLDILIRLIQSITGLVKAFFA